MLQVYHGTETGRKRDDSQPSELEWCSLQMVSAPPIGLSNDLTTVPEFTDLITDDEAWKQKKQKKRRLGKDDGMRWQYMRSDEMSAGQNMELDFATNQPQNR